MTKRSASKFDAIFSKEPLDAPPPIERAENPPPAAPASEPPPAPPASSVSRPGSMNFKLSAAQAEALALHRFRTGRQKQAIVSEALDMWLAKNKKLVQ
ncbi:hypothetical protein MHZ93_18060 [Roseomonas sp. ACRSG]|uniref:Uncharacterized protein n=1 Tax=Pseudoroseomonas ludipueritiae TaxID=198093 RepID=A0ABR7R8U6_9PROT|nr:hypothetical protein [Pseudoroseomonas ludipueritiae]MCG7363168.1 hypothetical protein [Roseomonas sp. ACRSG]